MTDTAIDAAKKIANANGEIDDLDEALKRAESEESDVIKVSDEDAATARAAERAIFDAQQKLGRVREAYILNEATCLEGIAKAREAFQSVLLTLGKKHGVDLTTGEQVFHFDTMTIGPRKPPSQ